MTAPWSCKDVTICRHESGLRGGPVETLLLNRRRILFLGGAIALDWSSRKSF
jgi:hypothetical protein